MTGTSIALTCACTEHPNFTTQYGETAGVA